MKNLAGRENGLYRRVFEVMLIHMEICRDVPTREQGPESPMWERDIGKRLEIKLLRRPRVNCQLFW